jgi:hypothetical protein
MSISSISTLPPALQKTTQTQPQNSQKPTTQATTQPVATDSDGDNDGSGGASITPPPVSIKA